MLCTVCPFPLPAFLILPFLETFCADYKFFVYHGLCGSNKLLYKQCAKSMGRPKIRPPQLPHFSNDLNETWSQERYPGYDVDPTCKIWLMRDDGKGVCVGKAFSVTFCVPFFLYFCSHLQVTPEDRSRPFMAQNACFRVRYALLGVSMIKSNVWGSKLPKNMIFGGILSQICESFESQYLEKYPLEQHEIWREISGAQMDFVGGLALQNYNSRWRQPPSWIFAQTNGAAAILNFIHHS